MRLTIDTREPDPHPWQTYLPAGWTATRAALETGDFALTALPERTVIERKTASIAPILTTADESAAMEDAVKDFERELSKPQQARLRRVAAKQFADVERENAEILRAHDEERKPLPAPNGKPSKLNRRQWVQVRTPLFKRWFGDWEALAKRSALEAMPANTPKIAIPEGFHGKQLRDAVKPLYEAQKASGFVMPDGRIINITKRGWKEINIHNADTRVLHIAANLQSLLSESIHLWSEDNTDSNFPNVRRFHNYGTRAVLNDIDSYVRFVIREDDNGQIHYDHDATSVEVFSANQSSEGASQPTRNPNPGEGAASLAKNRLYQWWHSVNPETVSKVVDENGEPMVVYHGTGVDFDTFDSNKTQDGYFWLTRNRESLERGEIGAAERDKTMALFLNAKRLAGWDEYDARSLGQLEAEGFDSVRLDDDYIAFNPNQIKSATGNEGMFSGSTRIDYSVARVVPPTSYPESAHRVIATTNVSALTKALLKADESLVILDPDKDKPMMVSPAYKRAKREGGKEDARDIVLHFLTPKRIQEYADALEGKKPLFVPVQQREGEAVNVLPVLFAKVLAQDIGGRVSDDVHQIGEGSNTGASAMERGNRQHDFVGSLKVNEGESVVLVDDTFTSGNTLAALYDYLHAQGIKAEHIFTLAASRYGKDMAVPKARQQAVLDRLGMDGASFQRATGLPIEAYTGSELQGFILLRGNPGIQSFLNRFHEGRNAQDSRLGGHARFASSEQTNGEKVNRPNDFSIGRTPVRDAMHAAMSLAPGERLAMYQRAQKLFDQANERRKAMQEESPDKYAKRLQSLWELDAILKVLPPEVRGRVLLSIPFVTPEPHEPNRTDPRHIRHTAEVATHE